MRRGGARKRRLRNGENRRCPSRRLPARLPSPATVPCVPATPLRDGLKRDAGSRVAPARYTNVLAPHLNI